MKEIPLSRDKVTLVDDSDYEWLMQWSWHAGCPNGLWYAQRSGSILNGQPKRMIRMHRQILGLEYGDKRKGDHINPAETLNNQRSNLRIVNAVQSAMNRRSFRNKSGYKGVSLHSQLKDKYQVHIRVNNKVLHLGLFKDPEEAYAVWCEAAKRYHGEFANFEIGKKFAPSSDAR